MVSDAAEEKGELNEGNKLKIFFIEFITIELTLSPNLTKLNSLSRLLDMYNDGWLVDLNGILRESGKSDLLYQIFSLRRLITRILSQQYQLTKGNHELYSILLFCKKNHTQHTRNFVADWGEEL